jgi:hypothetical protein
MKHRILFLLLFCAPFLGNTQTGNRQLPFPPNVYELQGDHLHVSYVTTGKTGKPRFSYQDANQSLSFTGDQIRTATTEIGTLVTVTLHMAVDSGSTSFTLLVPHVNLTKPGTNAQIQTIGITTAHQLALLRIGGKGQTQLYTETQLSGTASFVYF